MKKANIVLCLALTAALGACGTAGQYAATSSQKFRDGIYYTPTKAARVATETSAAETDALIAETQGSQIFLHSGQNDTLFIPKGKAASFQFNKDSGTTVTIYDQPSWYDTWYNDWSWGYRPWYYRSYYGPYYSSWYWGANPWYYSSWYWDPWYDPWYYSPYYSPWYYSSYYWDPWGYPYHYGYYGYYG